MNPLMLAWLLLVAVAGAAPVPDTGKDTVKYLPSSRTTSAPSPQDHGSTVPCDPKDPSCQPDLLGDLFLEIMNGVITSYYGKTYTHRPKNSMPKTGQQPGKQDYENEDKDDNESESKPDVDPDVSDEESFPQPADSPTDETGKVSGVSATPPSSGQGSFIPAPAPENDGKGSGSGGKGGEGGKGGGGGGGGGRGGRGGGSGEGEGSEEEGSGESSGESSGEGEGEAGEEGVP